MTSNISSYRKIMMHFKTCVPLISKQQIGILMTAM